MSKIKEILEKKGPLKNELGFQKTQIIERVNEKMGEKIITDVVIK